MDTKSKNYRTYRFLPAYILLFLAEGDLYGSAILNEFHNRMPNYTVDSAVIYRTLQDLEKEYFLESYWKTEDPGPATKWYKVTDSGTKKLAEFKIDIEKRKKNLEFFLETYYKLQHL
jgi:PadR family transcriptional regulator, regulatory protein PadR